MRMRHLGTCFFISLLLYFPGSEGKELSTLEFIDSIAPPGLMEGVGNSHLEISTEISDAQAFFDQGVSLLHDFWYFEAYRAFLHASSLDPNAPMPHWGRYRAAQNMANLDREEREALLEEIVNTIKRLRDAGSQREKYYLDSVIALHDEDGDAATEAHNRELVALLEAYPDELEARLFLWQRLDNGYDAAGKPRREQLYAEMLLAGELDENGDHHGLLHYWIHNQEPGAHPESALDAAKRLANLAPNAGHIVHMPGHIHYLMGNYDLAHEQFVRAQETEERYQAEHSIEPIFTWNYLHNFSFMTSNLAEAGRLQIGATYAKKLQDIAEASSFKHLPSFEMLLGRPILEHGFMAIRLERFEEAAALIGDERWSALEKSERLSAMQRAYAAYSAGMAAALLGDANAGRRYSQELDSVLWRSHRDEVSLGYRQTPLEVAALELQGMIAAAQNDYDTAIEILERAVTQEAEIGYGEPRANIHPAAESLARVKLMTADYEGAREAYQSVLKKRPNAGMPLYGIARSYELEGREVEAKAAYEDFLKAWSEADADLEQVQEASAWLERKNR